MQAAKLLGNNSLRANYPNACSFLNSIPVVCANGIRWRGDWTRRPARKPFWLPTAKSKMFRVPVRPKIPEDEYREICRLYNNYRTQMKSIRLYLNELGTQREAKEDQSILEKLEKEEFDRCLKLNDQWNKQIAQEREARLEEYREAKRMLILQNVQAKKLADQKLKLEIEQKVREAKALVPSLITRDNIDQAIEDALATTVDHNRALDSDGTWYTDKTGMPRAKDKDKMLEKVKMRQVV